MEGSHSKYTKQIYGTLRLYNSTVSNWIPIRGNEIGDVKYSLRSDDHLGWVVCDGRSLSRETYSELFNIIGTTYGSNSSTTFNLPDCRGRVLGGSGFGSGLTERSAGTLLGSETHTMTTNQMPTHIHTGTTSTDGLHIHTGTTSTDGLHTHTGTTSTDGSHTHTSNANGGQGGLGLVTANGANTETSADSSMGELNLWTLPAALTIDSNGNHNHTFTTITSGNHNHTFTTITNGNHNHTFTTNSAGNSQAFNIMQPTAFIGYVFVFANHI